MGLAVILGSVLAGEHVLPCGQAALLPPVVAAWAANVLFLAVAAYLTLTVRT
jgi:lipopolysaccharide export LptBFGC system permease protein LptF